MLMKRVIPALPVRQVGPAAAFYRDRLGFHVGFQNENFAIVLRDGAELHLWAAADERWQASDRNRSAPPVVSGAESFLAGTASCRIEVAGIDELYDEFTGSGVLYSPSTVIEEQPWGSREFPVLDLERNLITFFERT